ncbi:hypothetical protein [Arthrobacter sp. OV608]|uniref:hypothetical protein n=1 Tax=Arthrobacter sp. OV608 TaxID=1882768 RepID=UPI0008B37153|nr:hypothetical protein [Arthrobacter sp. OV608]SEQ79740.1 hypothetical protein SAMN05444745_11140 [Arthrobacter sp. OV608]
MPFVPGFKPSTHAPLFRNSPWPTGTNLTIQLPGLPTINVDATSFGLCGGMSFLARDIFEAGTPQLQGRNSQRIPVALAGYIMSRLIDSFNSPDIVARWLASTQALDHGTVLRGPGLFAATVAECTAVTDDIDAGVLCPIGVILVESFAPWAVFDNHVELVYGYERSGTELTLFVYDCNRPGMDDRTITIDDSAPRPAKTISTNATDGDGARAGTVRGFFRVPYVFKDPAHAYIDDAVTSIAVVPPVRMEAGEQATVTVNALNRGSTTWTPGQGYRLGSQAPQDSLTWGLSRVELPGGSSVAPDGTASFTFRISAPAGAGEFGFAWQMVHEMVVWFGTRTPRLPVAVGSTQGTVCTQLHRQYTAVRREAAEVQADLDAVDWSDPFTARREAAALARRLRGLRAQLASIENEQVAAGCAPG